MESEQIIVRERLLQQDMYYKDHMIMKYTIKYPKFISEKYQSLAYKLNSLYRTKALMYERSNIMNLYQMAMVEYEYSVVNNFPIHQFEAYTDFFVTYNENCAVSLYFDQYEYAGGAHGLTVRYSDTWNLQKSKRIDLNELFPGRADYREYIIETIDLQIQNQIAKGEDYYFENYSQLVSENFKVNSFYLTPEGVVIYFQQYDIAPYSSGLPTFLIPYSQMGPIPPTCC
ncbi:MAG: hypothetical protein K0S76_387 [Herbinix sp.]|nr:hypothetical protein [Herbinix sp.]